MDATTTTAAGMVTISEEYMQDIFNTIEDAIQQQIFLEDLVAKYNIQVYEFVQLRDELMITRNKLAETEVQLKRAEEVVKIEATYAKIILENLMMKDTNVDAIVKSNIPVRESKKRKLSTTNTSAK